MRLRSALFALLVACGSSASAPEPVATPVQRPVAAQPVIATNTVTLPAIAVDATPLRLDQIPSPWSLTASDGSGLVTTQVAAKAVVQGPLAFTELHLTFANTENRIREGTFAITLPANAAVSRFAMETDGVWMEAEVVEKQIARRAYEDFLHRKQDPALMEKAPGNQFTARVFPIPANSVKHIILSFSQELPGERYVLPLRGLPKVAQLDVELASMGPDGKRDKQTLSKKDWQPDADFVSQASTAAEAIASGELVVAQISAFDQATTHADIPKSMTLLVDTSASRALGFDHYASSVRELVGSLAAKYPGLSIDVVAFDQDTQTIYSGAATGFGASHVEQLLARGAAGASDLSQALAKLQLKDRVAIVTDGVLTAGSSGSELTDKLKALKVARIDVVMTGGIRDQALATSLATALPKAGAVLDLDQRLAEVTAGLGESVLTQVPVEVAGATWVYPKMIASARPNQRTMVYARMPQPASKLTVTVGNRKQTITSVAGTPALIDRAAASAEIVDLEARLAVAKADDTKTLRKDIIAKATRARVISSQTSMLVLESDGDYARYGIDRKALADILVVGKDGLEQRNRTQIAAIKQRPRTEARPQQQQNFALKDTTDPKLALRPRDEVTSGAGAGEARGYASAGAAVRSAPRIAVADKVDADLAYEPKKEIVADRVSPATGRPAPSMMPPPEAKPPTQPTTRPMPDGRIQPDAYLPPVAEPPAEVFPPRDAPPPLKGKLAEIDRLLRRKDLDGALAKAQDWHAKQPGDVLALIGLGEALEAKKDLAQAARIYGSIIDLFPGRADLRRFAGERLERIGDSSRWLAVDTYRRAVAERPDHMTGHRLLAYALLRDGKHADAFAAILKGLEQKYPEDRFAGGMRVLTEDAGLIGAAYLAAQPDKKSEILAALRKHDARLSTSSSTRFIMYWETDANDVDFHIQDARGGHAFYSNPELPSGGELYADITTGYGPECFTIPGRPSAGPYKLSINYYSQGPMGYGMGLLQIIRHDGKGKLEFQDRPYVIMNDEAYVNLGTFR